MRSFRNLCVALGCVALATASLAQKPADDGEGAKKKKGETSEKKKDGDGKKKKEKEKPEPMPFPLPIGHGGKGLRIPYLDGNAHKTMQFVVGTAERTEEDLVKMSKLKIEILAEDDAPEMTVDLPNASLNLVTRVIHGEKAVKVKREDFELSGDSLEFDTVAKQGTLKGHVRMLIYNLANELASDAPAQSSPEAKPRE